MPHHPAPHRRLRLKLSKQLKASHPTVFSGLPKLIGSPIHFSLRPELRTSGGKLLSGPARKGTAVYAASFIRKRKIVLETDLRRHPNLMRRILIHELFHFVWVRMGNSARNSFAQLLAEEQMARARGEIGESADVAKDRLAAAGGYKDRYWRDYVCESFCDSAAWVCGGLRSYRNCTLAGRFKDRRRKWFESFLSGEIYC